MKLTRKMTLKSVYFYPVLSVFKFNANKKEKERILPSGRQASSAVGDYSAEQGYYFVNLSRKESPAWKRNYCGLIADKFRGRVNVNVLRSVFVIRSFLVTFFQKDTSKES